jgi:hypothetical protein
VAITRNLDDLPNLKGLEGAVAYAAELGVDINIWYVKRAIGRGELRHYLIAHRRYFSSADVRRFLLERSVLTSN